MQRLGFLPYLDPEIQSFIITAFHSPGDPTFQFSEFYRRLSDRGMIIYPGKLTKVDTFRIGTVGRLFDTDIAQLRARDRGRSHRHELCLPAWTAEPENEAPGHQGATVTMT